MDQRDIIAAADELAKYMDPDWSSTNAIMILSLLMARANPYH